MMSHLCNRCVREFLILALTWFAFGLPFRTGCDRNEALEKDKILFSLVDRLKTSEAKLSAQAEARNVKVEDLR
jgi:hypothetical protein